LPYARQQIEDDDVAAVAEALRADFLTTGPRVDAFEAALLKVTGSNFVVACANGTAALHLASLALDLGPSDQVIVPSITFLATANAPHFTGAEIVFADVDPESALLTPATFAGALERAPRARAVFPVHIGGSWADMPAIADLARKHRIAVVEDACHALGTEYTADGVTGRVGDCRYAEMAVFSFHPVNAIAMGEGGAVATNDAGLSKRLRLLRNHGMSRDRSGFVSGELADDASGEPAPWFYEMAEPAYNYRVPDVLCALGISQLAKLDRFLARRRHLAAHYDEALLGLKGLVRPAARPHNCTSAFHLYSVLIDFARAGRTRVAVVEALREAGIGTQVHYIPVHLQPYYKSQPSFVDLTHAVSYYRKALSLPLFPAMTDTDVDRVVDQLARALGV
jgi:UDP-4-amino-4,6-dideoxy-N-acetyl-beta-L-altrosamine transaminase